MQWKIGVHWWIMEDKWKLLWKLLVRITNLKKEILNWFVEGK